MRIRLLVASLLLSCSVFSQTIETVATGVKSSMRGLSVLNDNIVWVSGSGGTVGRSLDGGKTWNWITVPGFEKREFRDIEAFDENTAVIIAVAEPGNILKTTDGGKTWTTVFTDTTKGVFLDAMDFSDAKNGIVVGDPINGQVYLRVTKDGGNSWAPYKGDAINVQKGEAFFAASGTNIILQGKDKFIAVSGGTISRLLQPGSAVELPMAKGKETTGAYSFAIYKDQVAVVGGDYMAPKETAGNCVMFKLSQPGSFRTPVAPPSGYMSGVEFIAAGQLICCGTTGVDISGDIGMHWTQISKDSYNAVKRSKTGRSVFLAGDGKVSKLIY
ncbi:oxidoreductase [Pseudoflavitalea sp. G-6-1-2]|uniref:WD40/YVTN/BNR-like repeat-containing protein n=1 Tax=Pseudoflavitalea sp. G-6-1-2 TaxID=2728841 RepID=UPI00146A667F|nr:YCF48-related protein [Pseudoflavitalea sp. G-6-1-2]NML22502.1 oxidoreductase [Pseudoflavitalea sp. G-6-1-2]